MIRHVFMPRRPGESNRLNVVVDRLALVDATVLVSTGFILEYVLPLPQAWLPPGRAGMRRRHQKFEYVTGSLPIIRCPAGPERS